LTVPRKILPRIVEVAPGEPPMTLRVRWDKGEESLIDVSGMIQSFRVYAPLRQSPELFRQVKVGEYGTDVVWSDEIDMAADTLWCLAQQQAGETMAPDAFRHWRERKAYTLDQAARALDLSRRTVAYYEEGRSRDPARRRVGDPSAGYGFYGLTKYIWCYGQRRLLIAVTQDLLKARQQVIKSGQKFKSATHPDALLTKRAAHRYAGPQAVSLPVRAGRGDSPSGTRDTSARQTRQFALLAAGAAPFGL
jgi:DNA-binding XRE family transcriptional regulator